MPWVVHGVPQYGHVQAVYIPVPLSHGTGNAMGCPWCPPVWPCPSCLYPCPFVSWDLGHHGAVHGVPQHDLVQTVHPIPLFHGTWDTMGLSMMSLSMALSKPSIPSLCPMGSGTPWGCPWCPLVWPCPNRPSHPFVPWDLGCHGAVHGVPQHDLVQAVLPIPLSHGTGDTMGCPWCPLVWPCPSCLYPRPFVSWDREHHGLSMMSPGMALSKLSIPSLCSLGQGTPWGCPWCPLVWPFPNSPSHPFVPWDLGHHGAVHGVPQHDLVQAVLPIALSHGTGDTMGCPWCLQYIWLSKPPWIPHNIPPSHLTSITLEQDVTVHFS